MSKMYRTINNFVGVGLMLSAIPIFIYLNRESLAINILFIGFFLVLCNEIVAPIIAKYLVNKYRKDEESAP